MGAAAKEAVPHLLRLLENDKDEDTVYFVASSLGDIGPDARVAAAALKQTFKSPELSMQIAAAIALAKLGLSSDESIQFLVAEAKNRGSAYRGTAAHGLWFVPSQRETAIAALTECLKDPKEFSMGIFTVQEIGKDAKFAIPILQEIAKDRKDIYIRRAAVNTLRKIQATD